MKRIGVITLIFIIVSCLIVSGCTIKCSDGSDCGGGLCYGCYDCAADLSSTCWVDSTLDDGISGKDAVEEGIDYDLEINFDYIGSASYADLEVLIEVYEPFTLQELEICIMQDGYVLGRLFISKTLAKGTFKEAERIEFKNYNKNGGEVYYILNSFVANRAV